ncbi:PTI1-like tyrosine-protein kinase 1 [Miscanthus floridulus]|uniref:PTI1-like tyrosine-protein kinase 1 n=1 Tax=Miscanthus floridulus TaxID=154761 RepID=UPI00345B2F31
MGWTKALFGRLTMWSSKKSSADSESSSSTSYPPVFAVDRTEVAVATATGVPELTLRELNKATRSFSAAMLIGRGKNNTAVYRASLPIGDGKAAAVAKRLGHPPASLSSSGTWNASDDEFLRQKVLVLSRLRHDNLVRLLGYTIDTTAGVRVLLFEFADMGTLHDVLHGPTGDPAAEPASSRPALSWSQRTGIALDVARGLEYLHDAAAVSHRAINSTKVLLFQGFRAKIADYDLFMQLPSDEDKAVNAVEFSWYPPEYVMTGQRGRKFDVYSYGVVLLELLTGRKRCAATPDLRKLLEWAASILREGRVEGFMDPKLGTQYPPARALKLARIAMCCLQENPKSRPSMADVAQTISCHIVSSETSMGQAV